MKNMKLNEGSFATAKLQAKMRSILAIIALVAVIGFGMAACSDDDDTDGGGGGGGGDGKSNWLWSHEKVYTVTDGVAGNVNYEYDVTWASYTDDKHYTRQYSFTQPVNTRNDNTAYTQTQVGSYQYSYNDSRDGNTSQSTSHTTYDYTITITYKDSSLSSYNSTTKTTQDITTTYSYVYDNDSGLTKSYTYQQTGTSNGTSVNGSGQQSYTIELLSTESGVKTYKSYLSSSTSNGTSVDVSTQGYTVYKIQNGITLEQKSYTAAGVLSSTTTYSFPDDATIRKKLPNYTISNSTSYGADGSTYSSNSTVEVLSDSNTELKILYKSYSIGKLSYQGEETYRRR